MRSRFRKFLTWTMLATYAGISLLGHGLHWLTPEDGHHHHSLTGVVYTCAEHHEHDSECCAAHNHDGLPTELSVTKSTITDSHNCEICEFLIHAVSQPAQVTSTPDLHTLVAEFSCETQGIYSQIFLGLHAARGPPQLLS